ncbi:MAG: glycosyltransferase [Flavobacterium sp.]|nr:glycosyltransferase [Flavobacterium sp.]
MVKLSIGIPVYNQVDTISETIVSILSQTIAPFEIVVCENYSTDGTREVVESFGDKVRIISPPEHLGMAANWNFCVNACAGDWVGLCSGDDLLLPDYVKHITKAINKHSSAGFIMGGWKRHFTETGLFEDHYLLSVAEKTTYPKALKMLLSGPKASFAAFCFKKSVFETIGGYDVTYNIIHDWMLQFDFAATRQVEFICINQLIAQYRISPRIELTESRKMITLNDYLEYLENKIWTAEGGNISHNTIVKCGKSIFLSIVLPFIKDSNISVRELDLKQLAKIGGKLGLENALNNFIKDGTIPSKKFFIKFKKVARNLYQHIYIGSN